MHPRKLILLVLLIFLALALIAGTGLASTGGNPSMWWYLLAGGGEASTSPGFALHGSIGQPLVGSMSNSNTRLASGFWPGEGNALGLPTQYLFIPLTLR
jgi:hypothetical protein